MEISPDETGRHMRLTSGWKLAAFQRKRSDGGEAVGKLKVASE